MKYYISVIKNYATLTGRARRKEYWMFILCNAIFTFGIEMLDRFVGDTFNYNGISLGFGYIYVVYALFVFIPGLAVFVRRLHDTGKSGWFFLLTFLPIVGWIWLFVLLCLDSNVGPNKYGPNPKGIGNIEDFDFMKTADAES